MDDVQKNVQLNDHDDAERAGEERAQEPATVRTYRLLANPRRVRRD